jgi:hypothetical protein
MTYATLDHDPSALGQSRFRKAVVEGPGAADGAVLVSFDGADEPPSAEAQVTLTAGAPPESGDRVLVAWSPDEAFVVGVLARGAPAAGARTMHLSDGAAVRVSGHGASERVQLVASDRALLMEYEPALGRLRLNAPAGNLELASPAGDIVLQAAGAVRLAGATLAVTAGQARLHLERSSFIGHEVEARVGAVRLVAGRIERVVDQIHEQANRVYQTVRETLQLRAGRVRSVVAGTYYMKARRTTMKVDDDFKVKGERIHLG